VDGDTGVRRAAVEALGRLGEHASPHAGAMAALLRHRDARVRKAAVEALGELGEHASPHAAAMAAMS
jgi:HEAT repeat protein